MIEKLIVFDIKTTIIFIHYYFVFTLNEITNICILVFRILLFGSLINGVASCDAEHLAQQRNLFFQFNSKNITCFQSKKIYEIY